MAINEKLAGSNEGKQRAGTFWETAYFAPLDGLRALSLLLVVAGHTRSALPIKGYFSGGLGVGIFFVLSGFLITILLLREELAWGSMSLGGFYIRRAFRILPPYFLALSVYMLIGLIPSQHALRAKFLSGLPYFLSLRNEYIPRGLEVAFTHSWSLSVEEKFYLLWPLLFFIVLSKLKGRWAVVPITFIPLVISPIQSIPVAYFSLLVGCCVAIALHGLRGKREEVLVWVHRVPVSLVLAVWLLCYFATLKGHFRVAFILSTAGLLPILLLRETLFSRVLGSRLCQWIGKRTYSMYLFHALCLTALEQRVLSPSTNVKYFGVVLLAYVSSLCVASVVYVVLEKPAIVGGRKIAGAYVARRRQQRGKAAEQRLAEYSAALPR